LSSFVIELQKLCGTQAHMSRLEEDNVSNAIRDSTKIAGAASAWQVLAELRDATDLDTASQSGEMCTWRRRWAEDS
jgi:hypothetical protein